MFQLIKIKPFFVLLPLLFASPWLSAETTPVNANKNPAFHFSASVNRTVEKDLMHATVYSRKTGKSLSALKKTVSTHLNKVLEQAKQLPDIDLHADGINNYAHYNNKGQVDGWVAEGSIHLKSKNFDAIAQILENLGDEVAISQIDFSVSPEKLSVLEDEMTLDIIKQFQHKASVIQKGLNAKSYVLSEVRLNTPDNRTHYEKAHPVAAMEKMASSFENAESLPLEAGKATLSATASGKVIFE